MKEIAKISEVLLIMFSVFLIQSCERNNKEVKESDKYLIEMNSEYRFSKVTHILENNSVQYEQSYEYSDKYVKIRLNNGLLTTYYLNQIGLADSCDENGTIKLFKYDQNNFLTSFSYKSGTIAYYGYNDGNRTTFEWGSNKADYQYNSQINLIDIDSFVGIFLGKINKNLLASAKLQFLMAGNGESSTYQYSLNPAGLVIQRIKISTPASGEPPIKTITKIEYIISK